MNNRPYRAKSPVLEKSSLFIDANGKLQLVESPTSKFQILRSSNNSTKQMFSEIVCSNIGLMPSNQQYQVQVIPVYGNWCGPGHGGDAEDNPPALDDVDRACMHHDLCYASRGYFDCNCDGRLLGELSTASASNEEGEAARAAMLLYFGGTKCLCKKRICVLNKCWDIFIESCCGSCPG